MLIMLLAAAMAPQMSPVIPPPSVEFDDAVTYFNHQRSYRPRRWPSRRWSRRVASQHSTAMVPVPVANAIALPPGDILIDTARHRLFYATALHHVESFSVAVGKQGASWKGTAVVGRKLVFPTWRPTAAMRRKERQLPSVVAPGRHNPLGTRALYLFRNGRDTMFRIHGTNAPWSIGKSVSHGCIRMLNANVEHLYDEVRLGAHVTVR